MKLTATVFSGVVLLAAVFSIAGLLGVHALAAAVLGLCWLSVPRKSK
jgi:hypothetical protein